MTHKKPAPYHPQANRQVEVTNKELENILAKTISLRKTDWSERLDEVIWAYNTTWNTTTGFSPYELVFGKTLIMHIEFELKTLRITLEVGINLSEAERIRVLPLNWLDEIRMEALQHTKMIQK